MSGPSSTSSSDRLLGRTALLQTLAWCVGLLVLARLAMEAFAPDTGYRVQIANAAEYLRESRDREVRVIAFGSSAMRSAFDPDEWTRLSAMDGGQAISLAVPSGRSFDALYMLRYAGGLPRATERVFVEVQAWEFNRNALNPLTHERVGTPAHYRRWASVAQRLALDDPLDRVRLTLEVAWPLYHRRTVSAWRLAFEGRGYRVPALPPEAPYWRGDPAELKRLADRPAYQGATIASHHFHESDLSGFARRTFRELVARLVEEGVEVVLVQLPSRHSYVEAARGNERSRDFTEEVIALARALEGPDVRLLIRPHVSDWELSEDIFVDYRHMHREGARAFTRALFVAARGP